MRRGDIELRIRGRRLADFNGEALAELVVAVTKLLGGARLVDIKPTHLTFRPANPTTETTSCDSNT